MWFLSSTTSCRCVPTPVLKRTERIRTPFQTAPKGPQSVLSHIFLSYKVLGSKPDSAKHTHPLRSESPLGPSTVTPSAQVLLGMAHAQRLTHLPAAVKLCSPPPTYLVLASIPMDVNLKIII